MIEVSHLTRRYGQLLAVEDVSFSLQPGRIYGFLGPNGAGKSTTMNILTGYLSAAEGSVTVNGWDVFEEPLQARRQIGYLPENPPLYMDMTVWEYLKFVAGLKKVSAKKAELESIVNSAVLRIVAALSALGFSIDGETLARAQQKVQQEMDRRYNTVQIN